MTMVKGISFETYDFVTDDNGNRQMDVKEWLVPNSDYAFFAIEERRDVRAIKIGNYFDFQFPRLVRIPNWLPNNMARDMIEDGTKEYRDDYALDSNESDRLAMSNGYSDISNCDEMIGSF